MRGYAENVAFLGQFGRFQQVVFFLLCATIVPNGFGAFTLVFLTDVPAHHCLVPELNLTEDWRGAAIPLQVVDGEQVRSSCSRYKLDVVRGLSAQGFAPSGVNLSGLQQEGCLDGWSYSTDVYSATIVSEYDLVCGDQWKQPFTTTVFFLGVIGCFFAGQLSDRFGRKPVLFATLAVQTLFTFVQVFSSSWSVFVILLFISSVGQMSNYVAALVLGAEILTGNVRVLYSSVGTCVGFTVGYMILPLFAYFLRDWKHLQLALSLPGLIFIPLWWLIPESPRWLLSQGRVTEAEDIVRRAAEWNRVRAPRVIFEGCSVSKTTTTPTAERHSVLDLLRTGSIRTSTLILCLVAVTIAVGYYGLSYNAAQLHGDPFVSCFISGAVELPAYVTSWLALRYVSRRLSVVCCMVLTAAPLCLLQLLPGDLSHVALALQMMGKYSITTCLSLMFTYSTELYPTVLRSTAIGVYNTVSRAGSCLMPALLQLSSYYRFFPYVVMGALALLSAVAAAFLPESFGKPLPETMEEMNSRERIKCLSCGEKRTFMPVVVVDERRAVMTTRCHDDALS